MNIRVIKLVLFSALSTSLVVAFQNCSSRSPQATDSSSQAASAQKLTCGASDAQILLSAPTADLCSTGATVSSLTGNGPWSWTCSGSGGAVVPCEAYKKNSFLLDLYTGLLNRQPDAAGYAYWMNEIQTQHTPCANIAATFLETQDFISQQASLSNQEYLNRLYAGLLDTTPDAAGNAYWLDELNRGVSSRAAVATNFLLSTGAQGFSAVCQSNGLTNIGSVQVTGF